MKGDLVEKSCKNERFAVRGYFQDSNIDNLISLPMHRKKIEEIPDSGIRHKNNIGGHDSDKSIVKNIPKECTTGQ